MNLKYIISARFPIKAVDGLSVLEMAWSDEGGRALLRNVRYEKGTLGAGIQGGYQVQAILEQEVQIIPRGIGFVDARKYLAAWSLLIPHALPACEQLMPGQLLFNDVLYNRRRSYGDLLSALTATSRMGKLLGVVLQSYEEDIERQEKVDAKLDGQDHKS